MEVGAVEVGFAERGGIDEDEEGNRELYRHCK